jgi:hypothetical protein
MPVQYGNKGRANACKTLALPDFLKKDQPSKGKFKLIVVLVSSCRQPLVSTTIRIHIPV